MPEVCARRCCFILLWAEVFDIVSPYCPFDQSLPQVTQEDLNAGVWTTLSDSGQGFSTISYTASVDGTAVNAEPVSESFRWTESLATHATIAIGVWCCAKTSKYRN